VVNVQTLEAITDAFNRHDVDAIMSFFSDDSTFDAPRGPDPYGTRYVGKDAIAGAFPARFEGLPDVRYHDGRHFVSGDRGSSEWLLTGTTPDGIRVEVRGCDLWEFRGDEVVRKDSNWKFVEA
jgi:ketosteroid isomerase-like protein